MLALDQYVLPLRRKLPIARDPVLGLYDWSDRTVGIVLKKLRCDRTPINRPLLATDRQRGVVMDEVAAAVEVNDCQMDR